MKIFLDSGFSEKHGGGIGVYSEQLYTGLRQRGLEVTRAQYKLLTNIKNAWFRRLCYSIYLNFLLPIFLKIKRFDVAHFTNFQIPVFRNNFTKYISTIHDINPIIFSETVSGSYTRYFKFILKNVIRNSDCIITVSESVKNELRNRFKLQGHKLRVCPIGLKNGKDFSCTTNLVLQKYSLKAKGYFLFVGRLEKRKNVIKLLQGFDQFKEKSKSNKRLVLVGSKGFGSDEVFNYLNNSKFRKDIIVTGYVTEHELTEFYTYALGFVFPSLNEGFGIPLLEAMKFKLPIILSQIPTNFEVVGSSGFYFDQDNEKGLADTLKRLDKQKIRTIDYSDILDNFTLDKMVESHINTYMKLKH